VFAVLLDAVDISSDPALWIALENSYWRTVSSGH